MLTYTTEYDNDTGTNGNLPEIRFLYNGQLGVVTDDNGLYYMRARYYNPEIKRFINQDILTGSIGNHKSLNRYSYVQGNPVSYTDPFGLSPFSYISEPIHTVLSMAGCIPFIGNFFDGLNSVVYLMEGETEKAVLNLTSLIPGDKIGKYVVKNGKKIAATTAITAVICQTDAGAGIKQGLTNAKNEIVEFYGLDDMSAADYVFMTLFGLQFAKGAKGGMLDIDLPTRNKSPEIELAGTGVTVKADSIDDVINKVDDVAPVNANKGNVDFYVTSSGDVVPATGYRYVSENASYLEDMMNDMSIPENKNGTYFSFDDFDVANPQALQVPHDASIKIEFDTLQIIDDIHIPNGNWGKASYLEPITKDFPQFGSGGATQVITYSKIQISVITKLLKK